MSSFTWKKNPRAYQERAIFLLQVFLMPILLVALTFKHCLAFVHIAKALLAWLRNATVLQIQIK